VYALRRDAAESRRWRATAVRRTVRDMNALLRELRLPMPQMRTLYFLAAAGGQSVSAIAERCATPCMREDG
jgi:DNA-binding MarR family transcriptional regulator